MAPPRLPPPLLARILPLLVTHPALAGRSALDRAAFRERTHLDSYFQHTTGFDWRESPARQKAA